MNNQNQLNVTFVSQLIQRQIPCLEKLKACKELDVKVHIDGFNFAVNQANKKYINQNYHRTEIHNNYFRKGFRCTGARTPFSVFIDPVHKSNYKYFFHVNLKNFSNSEDFEKYIQHLTGEHPSNLDARINRLDLAITSSLELITPQLIHTCCFMKWKGNATSFDSTKIDFNNGNVTGIRTNSRSMNSSSYDRIVKDDSIPIESGMRHELQIRGSTLNTLKLRTLSGFYEMDTDHIAERLEYYDPTITTASKTKEYDRFMKLQADIMAMGFNQARRKNNKDRHWDRNFKKLLVPLTIDNGKEKLSDHLAKHLRDWKTHWFTTEL